MQKVFYHYYSINKVHYNFFAALNCIVSLYIKFVALLSTIEILLIIELFGLMIRI